MPLLGLSKSTFAHRFRLVVRSMGLTLKGIAFGCLIGGDRYPFNWRDIYVDGSDIPENRSFATVYNFSYFVCAIGILAGTLLVWHAYVPEKTKFMMRRVRIVMISALCLIFAVACVLYVQKKQIWDQVCSGAVGVYGRFNFYALCTTFNATAVFLFFAWFSTLLSLGDEFLHGSATPAAAYSDGVKQDAMAGEMQSKNRDVSGA